MEVSLCFDVEDYTSPPEAGLDEIPKWLAEIMTEEGVRGSFLVIGGKARMLQQRGRQDVIAAMRKHEIGVHTNFGSEHPTLAEALAPLEWADGVKLCAEREGTAYRQLQEIFQVEPGSFSSHGASQAAPMHYVAGRKFDRPWLYSYVPCPVEGFCWYASCFQLKWNCLAMSEAAYSQPACVDETLARWDKQIDKMVKAGAQWSAIFLAHPLMIRCKQFNDALNFPDGKNRLPWRTPELRSAEEMQVAQQQFRRVLKHIASHPKVKVQTLHETYQRYARRKPFILKDELKIYVEHAHESGAVPTGYPFSPAEALQAVAEALRAGSAAERSSIREVLGPMAETPRAPDNALETLGADDIKALAQKLLDETNKTGHLPSALTTPNGSGRMGLPTLFLIFAEAWLQMNSQQNLSARVPHICGRYPNGAQEVEARARRAWLNWPIHDLYMPLENLSRQVRLQSWTWKRAWDGTDQAKRYETIRESDEL